MNVQDVTTRRSLSLTPLENLGESPEVEAIVMVLLTDEPIAPRGLT
jgi:hypothetical protein